MGVHISIETLAGKAHPTWDSLRYRDDPEFAAADLERIVLSDDDPYSPTFWQRPTDFAEWRKAFAHSPRHLGLLDILEADPSYYWVARW